MVVARGGVGKVGEGKINLLKKKENLTIASVCMTWLHWREWGKIYLSNLGNE